MKNQKIYMGTNIAQSLNNSLKNKFINKQNSTAGLKYKSGAITTSANTPCRTGNNTPKQRGMKKPLSNNPT